MARGPSQAQDPTNYSNFNNSDLLSSSITNTSNCHNDPLPYFPSPSTSLTQPTPGYDPLPKPTSQTWIPTAAELPTACWFPGCKNKKIFNTVCEYKRHNRIHDPQIPCPVSGCDKLFPWNKERNRHIWARHSLYARQHKIPEVKAKCPVCYELQREDNLKRHMKTHQR